MIESFLKYLQFEKRVSEHTLTAYQQDLSQFQAFLQQTFSVERPEVASHNEIRAWIISLAENNLEPRSVNRKIACLRSFFKFLLRQEAIGKDPMIKINALKTKKKLPAFVKEGDMINLLDRVTFEDTFRAQRARLMLELFYSTGIRLSELINLKDVDIDLHNYTIKVLGKRNKERVIPFPAPLVSIIKNYRQIRNREVVMENSEYLFVTEKGLPVYPGIVQQVVKEYLGQYTSSEKRNPHVLRHTYATHLLNKGAEINAVKDLLGHSSLAATQVYTHNSMEKLKQAFDKAHPKA